MLRLVGVGGVIAYRALFNWTTPAMFIGTLLVGPVFQLLFFAFLGRQLAVGSDHFYMVGNAVLASSGACVFGGVMAVANERRFGTLGPVLLSPRSRTAVFLGRALPYAANGLLIAATTLLGGVLVLGLHVPASALPGLLLAFAIGSVSCAFFGLALGAIGLRFRDVWLISNVAVALMLLLTGVNVPAAALPGWIRTVGSFVPITHAAEAARRLVAGASLGDSVAPLRAELGVGVAYAVLAAVLLKIFEAESRRRASLDTLTGPPRQSTCLFASTNVTLRHRIRGGRGDAVCVVSTAPSHATPRPTRQYSSPQTLDQPGRCSQTAIARPATLLAKRRVMGITSLSRRAGRATRRRTTRDGTAHHVTPVDIATV